MESPALFLSAPVRGLLQPRDKHSLEILGRIIHAKTTVTRTVINSNSPGPSPPPARRQPRTPAGTYTAQGQRVPPSAAGSGLQIKLPVSSAGRGARARRGSPREARVAAAARHARSQEAAESRRPVPAAARAPRTASRGAKSPGRGRQPHAAGTRSPSWRSRAPSSRLLASPLPPPSAFLLSLR